MYIIKRTDVELDKECGKASVIHDTFEKATEEAERLAAKHVHENPVFTVYELFERLIVSAKVEFTERSVG